jgi:hypothetical protein
VATRTCQLYVPKSTTWNAPSSVTSLQILAVGAGGGGGGGTTYAPGGGGGGGAVRECTVSLVDLSHAITITEGTGGVGGSDGSNFLDDYSYGADHGTAGTDGGATTVKSSKVLCSANGGKGGQTGYHYLSADLPTTPIYGGGGNSGSGVLGGSAAGLQVGNDTNACISGPWEYNIAASGGGGGVAGVAGSGTTSGAGGDGTTVSTGLFANFFGTYGGGGGGGGGYDCHAAHAGALGGTGGGGNGGSSFTPAVQPGIVSHGATATSATPGADNSGGGGGGGSGSNLNTQASFHGVGFLGAGGGSGVVIIRFAEPAVTSNAYFDSAKSTLTAQDKSALNTFVTTAIADNMATVNVTGYADPRGTAASNLALSTARANATANFLRKAFAARSFTITITATGKGATNKFGTYALDRVATITAQGGTVRLNV